MKLSIVIPYLRGGGSERFAVNLANGMISKGHEVFVLTAHPIENEYQLEDNVRRIELIKHKKILYDSSKLRSFNKKNKIDICVAIGIYPNICAGLASFGKYKKVKYILCERNDPVHDKLSILSKTARKLLFWRGDGFVFQTSDAKSFYSKAIQKRSVVISNPVKSGLPDRSDERKKEFVAVGRLSPQKNYKMLIKAFGVVCKNNKDYILRIFGQGELSEELKALANQLGIEERVIFEGYKENVHECIKDSDIYVLSSFFEGMPNALMEAMAMGFPVISTDCPAGGSKVLINDGINGLLTEVDDYEKLATKMLFMINNFHQKEMMGKEARKIREVCSLPAIIDKWENYINQINCE